jgi:hypothetical protein
VAAATTAAATCGGVTCTDNRGYHQGG